MLQWTQKPRLSILCLDRGNSSVNGQLSTQKWCGFHAWASEYFIGRYGGAEEVEDDGAPFEEKMAELSAQLYEQFEKSHELEAAIKKNLAVPGRGERQ